MTETKNPLFDAAFETFLQHYMQHSLDTTRPYDGIPELIRELKSRGCQMAVVSNKMMAATQELVHHFFPEIPVAIGENEAAGIHKKPAQETAFEALRQLAPITEWWGGGGGSADTPTAVYVGDSDVDLETARNAGLPCISVLWGFRDLEFIGEGAGQQTGRRKNSFTISSLKYPLLLARTKPPASTRNPPPTPSSKPCACSSPP